MRASTFGRRPPSRTLPLKFVIPPTILVTTSFRAAQGKTFTGVDQLAIGGYAKRQLNCNSFIIATIKHPPNKNPGYTTGCGTLLIKVGDPLGFHSEPYFRESDRKLLSLGRRKIQCQCSYLNGGFCDNFEVDLTTLGGENNMANPGGGEELKLWWEIPGHPII